MSKKSTAPEIAVEQPTPALSIRIKKKLLLARRKFREEGTPFSKHFNLHSGFEAFSVHILAGNIEPALNEMGIITECHVLKWEKNGNITVVECRMDFIDVETDEVSSILTVGEGVDGSDKGIGKAISNARKQGHIQAFNLAIGVDVEEADAKAAGVGSFGGAPAQYQPPQAFPQPTSRPYTIETIYGEIIEVVERDLVARFLDLVNNARTKDELDAFANRNVELANRLEGEGQLGNLTTLNNALEARHAVLAEGAHAAAA